MAVLRLKVLDPAMGSGHFLVAAPDYPTGEIDRLLGYGGELAHWLPEAAPYRSPLQARIERIREALRRQAAAGGWELRPNNLADYAIIRRLALKRRIYGMDLNPLAVELAKMSLWRHSFTVGAPLYASPQYWIGADFVSAKFPDTPPFAAGFRLITNATNERTLIATIVPWTGCGNSLPLLVCDADDAADAFTDCAPLWAANFSSFAMDFVARRKLQGANMNWYVLQQLPVIARAGCDRRFGDKTAPSWRATTPCASATRPGICHPLRWGRAMTRHRSAGMRKSGGICAPAWTPSTSSSTASAAMTPST